MKNKLVRTLLLIVLLVLAVVLGLVIANACRDVRGLSWLSASASFGISPTTVNLSVIQFTFGLSVQISAAQAILLLLAIVGFCSIRVRR